MQSERKEGAIFAFLNAFSFFIGVALYPIVLVFFTYAHVEDFANPILYFLSYGLIFFQIISHVGLTLILGLAFLGLFRVKGISYTFAMFLGGMLMFYITPLIIQASPEMVISLGLRPEVTDLLLEARPDFNIFHIVPIMIMLALIRGKKTLSMIFW